MTPADLRALADAANDPGEWVVLGPSFEVFRNDAGDLKFVASCNWFRNYAAFIAAANPQAVIALLDENAALRERVSGLEERLDFEARRGLALQDDRDTALARAEKAERERDDAEKYMEAAVAERDETRRVLRLVEEELKRGYSAKGAKSRPRWNRIRPLLLAALGEKA